MYSVQTERNKIYFSLLQFCSFSMNSVFNCLKLLQELLSPTLCISTSSFLSLFGAIRISTSIFTRSSGIIPLLPSIICSIHFAFQPTLQSFHLHQEQWHHPPSPQHYLQHPLCFSTYASMFP